MQRKKVQASPPRVKQTRIDSYQPDPANPNKHTERGVSMLEDSLASVGLGRSIVVDRNGYVIAGNSTQERSVDQGFEDAIEVETDGRQLVVVKRIDLDLLGDDTKARALSYWDNRTSQVSLQWDVEQLLADVNAGFDFSHLFSENELNNLLRANEVFDPNAEWQGMPEFEQEDATAFKSITVHFASENDMQAFADLVKQSVTIATRSIFFPPKQGEKVTNKAWVSDT